MSTDEFEPTPSWPPAGGTLARELWDMDGDEIDELFAEGGDREEGRR